MALRRRARIASGAAQRALRDRWRDPRRAGAHRATFVRRGRKTVHRCAAPRRRSRRRWRGRPGRAGVLMTVTAAQPRRLVVDLGVYGTILEVTCRLVWA